MCTAAGATVAVFDAGSTDEFVFVQDASSCIACYMVEYHLRYGRH
jgi:hypothetical protein